MKKQNVKQTKSNALTILDDRKSQQYLKHILSPLEQAALRHNYKPFSYKFEGASIYISGFACKHLLDISKTKISFLSHRIDLEDKSSKIPLKLREVFENPAEILSLPAYVRNRLCDLQCYSMFKVMVLGRQYFIDGKEFGKQSIKTIDELFAKHGCSNLFT